MVAPHPVTVPKKGPIDAFVCHHLRCEREWVSGGTGTTSVLSSAASDRREAAIFVRSSTGTVRRNPGGRAARVLGPLTISALAVSLAAAPASAAVAPTVAELSSPAGHPEILRLTASSDSPVSSVTVRVAGSGNATVLSTTMSPEAEGDGWATDPMVLPLGLYTATVVVTDADGDATQQQVAVRYLMQPMVVEHALDTTPLSLAHRSVRVSGQIKEYDPRTRTVVANTRAGHVALRVQSPEMGGDSRVLLLDTQGRYSVAYEPRSFGESTTLAVAAVWIPTAGVSAPDIVGGRRGDADVDDQIDAEQVEASAETARIRVDKSAIVVKMPAPAVVTATVERLVGSAWEPAAGARLVLDGFVDGRPEVATSQSNGRIRLLAEMPDWSSSDGTLTVRAQDPFLAVDGGASSPTLNVHLISVTKLRFSCHDLDATWVLRICGSLSFNPDISPGSNPRIYLETSSNGKSSWKSLGYIPAAAGGSSGSAYIEHPSWYYRLTFKGTANLQPSTSSVVKLARHDARIYAQKVTPTKLKKNKLVTVGGKAQKLSGGTFVSVGKKQEIQFFFRKKGNRSYQYVGSAYTSASGAFSKSFTAKADGYWSAVWFTNSKYYVNAYGPDVLVDVS